MGLLVGQIIGPPIQSFMVFLGDIIMRATLARPLIMGALVSLLVGVALTLPISSAALCLQGLLVGLLLWDVAAR